MSALLIAAALALAAAYLLAGWHFAMCRRARMWAAARETWTFEDSVRGSVRAQFTGTVLFWALLLPVLSGARRLDRVTGAGDPEELARKVAERGERIARLERELGIGRP